MKAILPSFYPYPKTSRFSPRHHISSKQKQQQNQRTQDDGIPTDSVKTLLQFKSQHNHIRVLEVSRIADHPFRGSRLLLLDSPGNIHSISFLFQTLTLTYFDVFATLPPLLPPGPIAILGFGAGSAANLLLNLYPHSVVLHGWEIDPSVVDVAREYFGIAELEKRFPQRLFIHVGDALDAALESGFAGILVDLFSKGSLVPELQDPATWGAMKGRLKEGGRIMVNVGGSCVEAEDSGRDGRAVMEETLMAMKVEFGELSVLSLGNRDDDSSLALTGELPEVQVWEDELPSPLKCYVRMWSPFTHTCT